MISPFAAFSDNIVHLVAAAAPLVTAIRIGPNRHITGLLCDSDTIVTSDPALPALDRYTVVLSNRALRAARPGPREAGSNLATLRLDTPCTYLNPEVAVAPAGSLAVVLGADFEASPTVRLTVVHRFIRTTDGPVAVLDLPGAGFETGGPVLDAKGRLIGLAAVGPNGEAITVPGAAIGRLLAQNRAVDALRPSVPSPGATSLRGWIGVSLQPIVVPDHLLSRAGQSSGRMVVGLNKGGPAEISGMRVGDVLLSLNGTSASGPQALRAFLEAGQAGTSVEVRLLRDGKVLTTDLTIGSQPD
jgi:S1-C subfamily serine protease